MVQAPAGSSLQYTGSDRAAGREDPRWRSRTSSSMFSVMGFSFSGAAPNQGIMFVRPEAVRPAQGRRPLVAGGDRPGDAQAAVDSRARSSCRFAPASIPGLSRFGGFEFQVLDQTGTDINTLARGRLRRHGRRGPVAAGAGRVHHVHRERSAAARQHRSAARAGGRAAARRDHERDADVPGVVVRERLPVQQPRLPRLRAGGPAVPLEPAGTSSSSTRARATGRWCRSRAS